MFGSDLQIKKYPYMATSPNLMEYFAIIGYPEKFVPQILDTYGKKKNIYSPTIISSITSNNDLGIIDNQLIIQQIYPDNPISILINKNDVNQEPPPTSNVIYSFCFDSTDGTQKNFYVCYALKFYEKYKYFITQTIFEEYYIPKAFCIISQYYYFTLFEYICKNIHTLIYQKTDLPLEIIIYNIVNFIPSPINSALNLDLFSNSLDVQDFEIGQLSGYPYLDFDLTEIFNLFPLNLFLEIYILTVIEESMLFFSSNLEILNMVMFIMYVLNYPCNDCTYFWHIVSVSKNNFVGENQFVGKIMVSLLGVNMAYSEDFDTSAFGKFHYIVDIDNKKLMLKKTEDLSEDVNEEKEYNSLKKLLAYLQNIIKDKDKNIESFFLKPFIDRLKKGLDFYISKKTDSKKIEFNTNIKNKYVNFFNSSKEIIEKNRKIQELFYDFILNIIMVFYLDNSLSSSFDKIEKDKTDENFKNRLYKLRKIEKDKVMNENEDFFCKQFRSSVKCKIYFDNFISDFKSLDIYKIPFLFSEEFINIKIIDKSNKIVNRLSLFNIIDSIYLPDNKRTYNITLNNIISDYINKLKKYFKCFYTADKLKIINKRQLFILNKKIINKYIYLLNNYYKKEELMDIFPSLRIQEKTKIEKIDRSCIINNIQKTLEEKKFFENKNYLIYALVYIYAISVPFHPYLKMIKHLEKIVSSLSKTKLFMRANIYIIIKALYKFYLINEKKNIFPEVDVPRLKMNFFILINFLKGNFLLPNEEMMKILHFFSPIIKQEKNKRNNKNGKENDNEADFIIEKNKNFIILMKFCFNDKRIFKSSEMVNSAMKEINSSNIVVRGGKKLLKPKILIKIKEYSYSSEFFSPRKIYKLIQLTFNHCFDNAELDMSKLKIKNVRDVIINLIQYGLELNTNIEIIPIDFLIYTLYLFKSHEEKYGVNNNDEK